MNIASILNNNLILLTGHYGCGKTNLSINLALSLAQQNKNVTVVDLDIVNPYFRISDSTNFLQSAGINMVAPVFAGTTLDTPSLGPATDRAINDAAAKKTTAIIDVGGDPDGATALGRYRKAIAKAGYQMLYVVNQRRFQTASAQEAAELLEEIERVSGLKGTFVVGNTHLKKETTADIILDAVPFAQDVAKLVELPLVFVTAPTEIAAQVDKKLNSDPVVFPVEMYVKTPWE